MFGQSESGESLMATKTLIEATRRDGILVKGEWRKLTHRGNGSTVNSIAVCCPGCGHIVTISLRAGSGHTIDPDGTVMPSLVCPFDTCDFHEFVKLADWRA